MFGWKICSKCNFIATFLIFANFTAFHDHTKENADVSKMMTNLKSIFIFTEKYMPVALSIPNLVAVPIISQELGRRAFCHPPRNQNRMYQIAKPL